MEAIVSTDQPLRLSCISLSFIGGSSLMYLFGAFWIVSGWINIFLLNSHGVGNI